MHRTGFLCAFLCPVLVLSSQFVVASQNEAAGECGPEEGLGGNSMDCLADSIASMDVGGGRAGEQDPQPAVSCRLGSSFNRLLAVASPAAEIGENGARTLLRRLDKDLKQEVLKRMPLGRYSSTLEQYKVLESSWQPQMTEANVLGKYVELLYWLVRRLVDEMMGASKRDGRRQWIDLLTLTQLLKELVKDIFDVLDEKQDEEAVILFCAALAADQRLSAVVWEAYFMSIVKDLAAEAALRDFIIRGPEAILLAAAWTGQTNVSETIAVLFQGSMPAINFETASQRYKLTAETQRGLNELSLFLSARKRG